MINELSALRIIEEQFPSANDCVEVGIGDDSAALRVSPGRLLLATTDCQVEDVHFQKAYITPEQLARRSVAVSVSDVGAMGGVPKFILASLGFSGDEDEAYLGKLIDGFRASEKEFGVKLVGGNLSSSEKLFLDVTTLGEVEPDKMVRRSGASPGDAIFVSGTLGDSALGLKLLKDGRNTDEYKYLIGRHLNPGPRLALGRRLALSGAATSMIDVSDGLTLDLERITVQQGVGARIYLDSIPVSSDYTKHAAGYGGDVFADALGGGEDYELLFTSSPGRRNDVREISAALAILITEIGEVVSGPEIAITDRDVKKVSIKRKGFIHFGD